METNTRLEAKWLANDIIRHKVSGHPYLVLYVSKRAYSIIIDLEAKETPPPSLILLPRDFDNYAKDEQMEKKIAGWEYNYVTI